MKDVLLTLALIFFLVFLVIWAVDIPLELIIDVFLLPIILLMCVIVAIGITLAIFFWVEHINSRILNIALTVIFLGVLFLIATYLRNL